MRIKCLAVLLWFCVGCGMAIAEESRLTYATGGMIRLPNSQQPSDADNAIFEGWFKVGLPLHDNLTVSLRFKGLSDTLGYPYNNSLTTGLELAYKVPLGRAGTLKFKARRDWQKRSDGVERAGLRVFLDYHYMNYKVSKTNKKMFGLQVRANVLTVYGTLTFPETLVSGDTNVTVQGGSVYSMQLDIPNSRLKLAPYVGIFVSWDREGFNYNNKAQPSIGVKLKRPLPNGDIHLGLRYQGDFRWRSDTFEHGPSVFLGWYSDF